MKIRSLFYGILCMLAIGGTMASCSDDDEGWDDEGTKVEVPHQRAYILNEGKLKSNNAGIAFYDPNGSAAFINDIFFTQNSAKLGDTGQDIIEYDGEIFVSVYGSNYLLKLNAAGVEEGRVSFVSDPDLAAGIRYLAADDGYIYASFYYGAVAKINARTLQVEKKLTGLGGCMEAVVIEDDLLYVTNACAADWTPNNEIEVIDLSTFTLKETITTLVPNPYNQMVEEEGKIFFISNVYTAPGSVLQMIDTKNGNKVTELGNASHLATYNDVVYVVNSFTDWYGTGETTTTFYTYDAKAGKLNNSSFLKNAPSELTSTSINMLEINPGNGDIYLAVSDYNANGTIYRFRKDGSFVEKFDAGGMNPSGMVFFN